MAELKDPKIFSLEEARETLPFVRQIVQDVMNTHKEVQRLEQVIQRRNDLDERRRIVLERNRLKAQIEEYQQELDLVGCHLKNPDLGIVGYYWDPGDGSIMELCWQYGDEDISHCQEIGHNKMWPLTEFLFPPYEGREPRLTP